MADKNTRWENDKEWAGWTVRDEIYAYIRDYIREHWIPTVVSFAGAIGGTVWAFLESHSTIGFSILSATLGVAAIVGLALPDARKKLGSEKIPPTSAEHTALSAPAPRRPVSPETEEALKATASVLTEHAEPPDFYHYPRVYGVDPDGVLRLVFLPDTDETQDGDALLVLVLGRKLMMGIDESSIADVHESILRSGVKRHYPKGRQGELQRLGDLAVKGDSPDLDGIAKSQINLGFIVKVALSRGGAYKLTEQGRTRAIHLLWDMVERA